MQHKPDTLFLLIMITCFALVSFSVKAESYKGSQAYNDQKMFRSQVNTATGTFSFSYPVIDVPGIREPLQLQVEYHFNAVGMFGLPEGWRFDIDYIADKTAQLGGKQWLIDLGWHDETGYGSGLKYYNQHGAKFEDFGESKPIPGFEGLDYRYKASHKDGSVQYFSHQGLLVLRLDRFKNAVQFIYQAPIDKLESARLEKIIDNFGNIYRFAYEPNKIIIKHPDDREYALYFNKNGLSEIVNPLKQVYNITYLPVDGKNMIRTIESPEGLMTDLVYDSIPYNASGSTKKLPVVTHFKQFDLADNTVHHEVNYQYAEGNNYTGYPKFSLSDEGDNLMDSGDQSYRYSVNVFRINDKQLNNQVYEYNYLHLPVEIRSLKEGKPYTKTTFEYDIPPFKYSRLTNYDKPLNVTHWVWHEDKSAYIASDKIDTQYDRYGNKITSIESVYDQESAQWKTLKTTKSAYFEDNFSLLKQKIEQDELTGRVQERSYQLAKDGLTHSQETQRYKVDSQQATWQPWKQKVFQYDPQGRKRSTTTSWLIGNQPGVESITQKVNFVFNTENYALEVTKVSGSGREHKRVIDTRNGQKLKEITPKGEVTAFTYDLLNRETSRTDPEGNVIKTCYEVFADDKQNSVIHQSPLGNKQQTLFDASNRMIAHNDEYNGHWRRLFSQRYNAFGKVVAKIDRLGLQTTIEYDEQERPINILDHYGNEQCFNYNDPELITTIKVNGKKRSVHKKQPWARKTITQSFPVADNAYERVEDYIEKMEVHDGFSKLIHQQTSLVNLYTFKSHDAIDIWYQYDASQHLMQSKIKTFDQYETVKNSQYDLAGKLFTWHKMHTGPNGKSEHQGYRYHYDEDGLLVQVESPELNGTDRLSTYHHYDANGNEIERTLQDGHKIAYQYNARGMLIARAWNRNQQPYQARNHYDADGRLIAVSDNENQWLHYRYAPNGALMEMHYPDNRSLKIERDAFDRFYRQTDVNGVTQTWNYAKDNGQLSHIETQDSKISFYYGVDDNGLKGQLIQRDVNGNGTGLVQTHYTYSAQGRLNSARVIYQRDQSESYVQYHNTSLGEIRGVDQDFKPAGVTDRSAMQFYYTEFKYDGLRRLQFEEHYQMGDEGKVGWGRHYHYDGNDNLIKEITSDKGNKAEDINYVYNAIDQLVNMKTNGHESPVSLAHDKNGRLLQDHLGRKYVYDDAGYLLKVWLNGEATEYRYWPNGILGHTFKGTAHSDYYPDHHNHVQTVYENHCWKNFIRHNQDIISVENENGIGQTLTVNNSLGAYLHLKPSGDVAFDMQRYDAYGKVLAFNPHNDYVLKAFGWNQELNNPFLGLTYLRHRIYQSEIRQYITRDSWGEDNRYAYAFANPVSYTDPSGYSPVLNYTLGSGFTALGILGAVLAIPTGGASLSLSAGAGFGAGVASALSGISLLGSQAALDAGNKTAAKALSVSSIALSVVAIAGVAVSLAPTISNVAAATSRFFGSSGGASADVSSGTSAASKMAALVDPGKTEPGVSSASAAATNTEGVVSGWSIAATVTENAADLTTDVFANHGVDETIIDGLRDQQVTDKRSMASIFPENIILNQHAWLTRMRGWLFMRMAPDDVVSFFDHYQAGMVFSEEDLSLVTDPKGMDGCKRFEVPSQKMRVGFSLFNVPKGN